MSFCAVDTILDRLARSTDEHYATIEIGREASKNGMIVRVEHVVSSGQVREILRAAFDLAASIEPHLRRVDDSGWWAGVVCAASLKRGRPAIIQRNHRRSKIHACVVTEGARLLGEGAWPMCRVGTGGLVDLRPDRVLLEGPTDADLERFAFVQGISNDASSLRELFHLGVICWADRPDSKTGRRVLRAVVQ